MTRGAVRNVHHAHEFSVFHLPIVNPVENWISLPPAMVGWAELAKPNTTARCNAVAVAVAKIAVLG